MSDDESLENSNMSPGAEPAVPPAPEPPPPEQIFGQVEVYTITPATRARIVDLCAHAIRTDAGGTGKLAQEILADLGA